MRMLQCQKCRLWTLQAREKESIASLEVEALAVSEVVPQSVVQVDLEGRLVAEIWKDAEVCRCVVKQGEGASVCHMMRFQRLIGVACVFL